MGRSREDDASADVRLADANLDLGDFEMSKLGTAKMLLRRTPKLEQQTDLYTHEVQLLEGGEINLASLRGKPTLIVNTASKCGFTPQYEGLQKLHERFKDQGLNVIGFPSGDFADQEFEDAAEIGEFCQKNYGVTFPLSERTSVRENPSPLWRELTSQPNSAPPSWNFNKYLVGADGRLIAHWGSKTTPDDPELVSAIEQALPER
jgi:glutathione peroxidase